MLEKVLENENSAIFERKKMEKVEIALIFEKGQEKRTVLEARCYYYCLVTPLTLLLFQI